MVSQIQNINALIQFTPGEGKDWTSVDVPVPAGVWVLDTDTKLIYLGDGVELIGNLPVFWDLTQGDRLEDFVSMFPEGLESQPSKIFTVNSTADGFALSSILINETVSLTELTALLDAVSNMSHEHGDIYYTKDEIKAAAAAQSSFSTHESDIISMLVLDAMTRDAENYKLLPNGVADEFEDTSKVDPSSEAVYDATNKKYEISGYLVTVPRTADANVSNVSVIARCKLPNGSAVGRDIEISRDGGSTYALADVDLSNMVCTDFNFITASCDFDQERVISDVDVDAAMAIESHHEAATQFIVDEDFESGHFNNPITGNINGTMITTGAGMAFIMSVTDDGTAEKSVKFHGDLTAGGYALDTVAKLDHKDGAITGVQEEQKSWKRLNDEHPTARFRCRGTVVGDAFYLFSGNGSGLEDDFYKFDFITKQWTRLSTVGVPARQRHAIESIGTKIYVFAGNDASASTDYFHVYDTVTGVWTELTKGPSARRNTTLVAYNNKLYVYGGYPDLNDLWEYDPSTDTWTELSVSNITGRGIHAAAVVGDKMYIIGGYASSSYVAEVWEYDFIAQEFTQLNNFPTVIGTNYVEVIDGIIYSSGGTTNGSDSGNTTTGYKYDIGSDAWTPIANNSIAMRNGAVGTYDGKLYLYGGRVNDGSDDGNLYAYDPAEDQFIDGVADAPVAMSFPGAAAVNGKIYVAGGHDGSGWSKRTDEYDPATNMWTRKQDRPIEAIEHMTCECNGKLYTVGGHVGPGGSGGNSNLFYSYDPTTDTWDTLPVAPSNLKMADMVSVGNKLYVPGSDGGSSNMYIFDTDANSWSTEAGVPGEIYTYTAIAIGTKIYKTGGQGRTTNVYVYDTVGGTWDEVASIPIGVYRAASCTVDGKWFVTCGDAGSGSISTIQMYDPDLDKWVKWSDGITERQYHFAEVVGTTMYVGGGTFNVDKFDTTKDNSWEVVPATMPGSYRNGQCVVGDELYIKAGHMRDFWKYNVKTKVWTRLSDAPDERRYIDIAHIDGKIYMFGGTCGFSTPRDKTDLWAYDIATDAWQLKNATSDNIYAYHAVAYNGKMYIFGGYDNVAKSHQDRVRIYDPVADSFTEGTASGVPTIYGGHVVVGNKWYIIAGRNDNVGLKSMQVYDFDADTWDHNKADAPQVMHLMGTASIGTKIYLISGYKNWNIADEGWMDKSYIYDTISDVWETHPGIPWAVHSAKASVVDGKIYQFGGRDSAAIDLNWLIEYDPFVQNWEQIALNPDAGLPYWGAVLQDKLYIFGGVNNFNTYSKTSWYFDLIKREWVRIADLPSGRPATQNHTVVQWDNKLWIFGGWRQEGSAVSDLYVYDPATDSYEKKADCPEGLGYHTAAVYDNHMYIHGGYSLNTGNICDNLWQYSLYNNTWVQKADGPLKSHSHVATFDESSGIMYVSGGYSGGFYTGQGIGPYLSSLRSYNVATNTWVSHAVMPGMPQKSCYGNGFYKDGKIYHHGGSNGTERLALLMAYDIAGDAWSIVDDFNGEAVYRWSQHALVLWNDELYIGGGYCHPIGITNSVWKYDFSNPGSWEELITHSIDMYRTKPAMAFIDDQLFIFGGQNIGNAADAYNDLWIYYPSINKFYRQDGGTAPIPARYNHRMVAVGRKLYVTGGNTDVTFQDLWEYNIDTHKWTELKQPPVQRSLHAFCAIGDKLYVQGGHYSGTYYDHLYEYDIATNVWTQKASSGQAVAWHQGIACNGKFYIVGGRTATSSYTTKMMEYDPATDTWAERADVPRETYNYILGEMNGEIYLIGGYDFDRPGQTDAVWKFNPAKNTWIQTERMIDMISLSSVASYKDDLYLFGGNAHTTERVGATGLMKYNEIVKPEDFSLIEFDTNTTRLDAVLSAGIDLDNTYVVVRIDNEYKAFINGLWKDVARYEVDTWEYNVGSWVAASVNDEIVAIREAISKSVGNRVSASDFSKKLLDSVNADKVYMVFDMDDVATLQAVKLFSNQSATFDEGKDISVRVIDYNDTPMDVHGLRTRW